MLPRRALPLDPRRLNRTSDINETVLWVIYRRQFILPRGLRPSLLLNPKDGILCRLGDPEFQDSLGRNFDFPL
jgi:hypothetical protein